MSALQMVKGRSRIKVQLKPFCSDDHPKGQKIIGIVIPVSPILAENRQ